MKCVVVVCLLVALCQIPSNGQSDECYPKVPGFASNPSHVTIPKGCTQGRIKWTYPAGNTLEITTENSGVKLCIDPQRTESVCTTKDKLTFLGMDAHYTDLISYNVTTQS